MGRPLNKKYFGNRNVGVNSPTDDMIGGEGIASLNISNAGSFRTAPTAFTLPAPTIANGTTATLGTIVYNVQSVTTNAGKTGLVTGDTYTYGGTGGAVITVGSLSGANAVFTVTNPGTGVTTLPNGGTTTTITITKASGTGVSTFTVDMNWQIASAPIATPGSGYRGTETLTITGTATLPAATIVLTTDSGAPGSLTNDENAIIAYAYTGGSLVEVDIQKQISSKRYRVNKTGEVSSTGVEIARLRYDAEADGTAGYTAGQGVELNIVATDSAGGTYLVRKLTNHTCTLSPQAITRLSSSAGSQFAAGIQVPWTFGTPTVNYSVQIENA